MGEGAFFLPPALRRDLEASGRASISSRRSGSDHGFRRSALPWQGIAVPGLPTMRRLTLAIACMPVPLPSASLFLKQLETSPALYKSTQSGLPVVIRSHHFASRSGSSRGERSVRFRLTEPQDSLPSVAGSDGGTSDTLTWTATGTELTASRWPSMTGRRSRDSSPSRSRRSLEALGRIPWTMKLGGRAEATPVRSSGTYTRGEEGSFQPMLRALSERTPTSLQPAGGLGRAQVGSALSLNAGCCTEGV